MRTEYKGIKPLFNQALTKGLEKTKSKSLEDKSEMLNPGGMRLRWLLKNLTFRGGLAAPLPRDTEKKRHNL